MPLQSGELKFFGSANMPQTGNAIAGGGIDLTTKVIFEDATLANTFNDVIEILSNVAADTAQVTITGRDSVGVIRSEQLQLNGTAAVTGVQVFERILKAVSTNHTGNITLRKSVGDTGLAIMETGILTLRRPFYDVAADPTGGATRNFYEKVFLKNTSTSFALSNALLIESSDPSGKITFAHESGKNGTTMIATRETPPHSSVAFDSLNKAIPEGFLSTGEAIGLWLNLTLNAGDAPAKTTYTIAASGTTT